MGAKNSANISRSDPTENAELFDESGQCQFYRNSEGKEFEKYKIENDGTSDFHNRY